MSLKIVHIGKATAGTEVEHIKCQRDAGNEVYVYAPGQNTYEQLMRRIIDADEIHIFAADMPFELGMVYFFSLHALHHKLTGASGCFVILIQPYWCSSGSRCLCVLTQNSRHTLAAISAKQKQIVRSANYEH